MKTTMKTTLTEIFLNKHSKLNFNTIFVWALPLIFAGGCGPVKLEAPDKPIVINMNMHIKHEVKVKIKDDLLKAKKERPDIF
jgi:hypothetical protein